MFMSLEHGWVNRCKNGEKDQLSHTAKSKLWVKPYLGGWANANFVLMPQIQLIIFFESKSTFSQSFLSHRCWGTNGYVKSLVFRVGLSGWMEALRQFYGGYVLTASVTKGPSWRGGQKLPAEVTIKEIYLITSANETSCLNVWNSTAHSFTTNTQLPYLFPLTKSDLQVFQIIGRFSLK